MGPLSRRNENYDPVIFMSKELNSPKLNLIPKVDRYNILNNHSAMYDDLVNVSSVAASHDLVRGPIRQNYMQQKQILQQVYGAYRYNNIQRNRRGEVVGLSVDSGRVSSVRQII